MKVTVCVGSSCHLKGSYGVIEKMKKLISEHGLEDKITLQASFCLGQCSKGVAVKADEIILHNVNESNAEEVFETQVLTKL